MRVVIADDHRIVREGLTVLLSSEPDVDLVGEADGGEPLMEFLEHDPPDVVLLDLRMPGMSGLEVLSEMKKRSITTPVIMLSMFDDPTHVKRAIELGASGYLLKAVGREELLRALRIVAEGGSYIQGEITAPLIAHMVDPDGSATVGELNPRDAEMLGMLATGKNNRVMADELGLTEAALKAQLRNLYHRLNVKRRSEAVAVAMRLGVIS